MPYRTPAEKPKEPASRDLIELDHLLFGYMSDEYDRTGRTVFDLEELKREFPDLSASLIFRALKWHLGGGQNLETEIIVFNKGKQVWSGDMKSFSQTDNKMFPNLWSVYINELEGYHPKSDDITKPHLKVYFNLSSKYLKRKSETEKGFEYINKIMNYGQEDKDMSKEEIQKEQLRKFIVGLVKEQIMSDVGETSNRNILLQNIMSSLEDAENTRTSLISDMEEVTDPVELEKYRTALEKFDAVIADKKEMIHSLSRGPTRLGKRLPEQKK